MKQRIIMLILLCFAGLLGMTGVKTAEVSAAEMKYVTRTSLESKQAETPPPSNTPKPTESPKPTSTPKPTKPPKPTETPKPTEPPVEIDYSSVLSMEQPEVVTTVGQTTKLKINGLENVGSYQVQWFSEDNSILMVNQRGEVTPLAMTTENGVKVTGVVTIGMKDYVVESIFYVSEPKLVSNTTILRVGKSKQIEVSGLLSRSKVTYETSDPGVALVNEMGIVSAFTTGQTIITITVDGQKIEYHVIVTNATLNCTWFLSSKGKTKKLSVSGHSGTTPVTFKSENTSIATVSASGKIKAKKIGNTKITVNVDGIKLTCVVNITYKKAINVINKGKKKLGYKYSQARRMSSKYFDCSSFVWRMYKTQGIYFGSKRRAPVAASEAKIMVSRKKVIAYKYVKPSKLLAGDIIFIKGKRNGRYRNICHVAIYIGNGKILHATPPCVKYGDYEMYRSRITVIARPCK